MSLAHQIDNLVDFSLPFVVLICVIAWVIAMVAQIKRRRASDSQKQARLAKIFYVAILAFPGAIFSILFMCGIVQSDTGAEVKAMLQNEIVTVKINENILIAPTSLIADIRNMDTSDTRYHHTHPTHKIEVLLETKNDTLKLELARDSGNAHEYWVFYPKFLITSSNDIGRVHTTALDGY